MPVPALTATVLPPLAASRLAIRSLHVLAMAVAVGGATLAWILLRRFADPSAPSATPTDAPSVAVAHRVAAAYEWLFWAALGVLVLTGVGNLGSLAPTLPGGRWGLVLDVKLPLVLALLVGSAVRTLLLVRARAGVDPPSPLTLRHAYAATALVLLLVVALGEVLAHG